MLETAMSVRRLIPVLLLMTAGISCSVENSRTRAAAPPPFDPRLTVVRDFVVEEVAAGNVTSVSIAVAQNRRILWEEAFGWADTEARIPADPNTAYRSGSIAKPITATAVMRLAEAGLVDLDAPIERYLGGLTLHYYVGTPADVTVRRVLQHRAGLPPHNQLLFVDEEPERRPFRETVRRYGNVLFEPGRSNIYSNLGYQLLAYLVEQVSGTPFPDYVRDSVFTPLGMATAQVYAGGTLPPQAAKSYYGVNGKQVAYNTATYYGSGDVYCSAHDLLRFAMFHLEDHLPDQARVLTDSSIDAMQREDSPSNTRYGIGWSLGVDELGTRLVHHGGQSTGVSNLMVLVPSEDLAYVILTNTDYDAEKLLHIHRAIRAALNPEYEEARLARADSQTGDTEASDQDSVPTQLFPEQLVGTWEGRIVAYDRELDVTLVLDNDAGARIKLSRQGERTVDFSYVDSSFVFGTFAGSIPTPDVARYDHSVRLALVRTGGKLAGQATAVGWREDRQTDCELSSWIELWRQ